MSSHRAIFQSSLDPETYQQGKRLAYQGLVVLGAGFLAASVWVACAPLSGAIIAPASVKVDTNRKTVQHQEGGIVKEILVRDGDRVDAGQPLIVLDDVRVDSNYESLRTQLDSEMARNARLLAEQALSPRVSLGSQLEQRASDPRMAELIQREIMLFAARREALNSQIRLLQAQAEQTRQEVAARLEQHVAERRSVALQQEELDANRVLMEQGFVSKTRFLTLQRGVADSQARWGSNQAETARARQKIAELELRVVATRNAYMQQAADELKESTARIFDLEQRLRSAQDAAERQKIVAPITGTVVDLKVNGIGSVIAPRQPLLDIVPHNTDLVIEARIRPEDINYVHLGSVTDVRLTSFKSRITPVVTGSVVYVSADTLNDEGHTSTYYVARVHVGPEALKALGEVRLQPGMPAEVFIITGERSMLEYAADPILSFLQRGFREP